MNIEQLLYLMQFGSMNKIKMGMDIKEYPFLLLKQRIENMEKKIIIVFCDMRTGKQVDLEVPLNITANELFIALNQAFYFEKDANKMLENYLKCENPIALLKGNKTLKEFGLHNGSFVMFS